MLTIGPLFFSAVAAVAPVKQGLRAPSLPTIAMLDQNAIASEYRRPIEASGLKPNWTVRIEIGEARLRVGKEPERRIPLLTPIKCFVVRCEGVMIEQAVEHRHHGVSIIKAECKLPGSDRTYPYRVSVSVLRSIEDTVGVSYQGCGWPAVS